MLTGVISLVPLEIRLSVHWSCLEAKKTMMDSSPQECVRAKEAHAEKQKKVG
jgi:hypothetical protein